MDKIATTITKKSGSVIHSYKELSSYQGGLLRKMLRYLALEGLSGWKALLGKEHLLKTPRIQFLFIHHIFEDEERNFERIVKYLSKDHTFISHSEAVSRLLNGEIDKPYISWSSDDGLLNNLKAAEILEKYNAQCCFFINPYSIGLTDFNKIKKFCHDKLWIPEVEFLNWDQVAELQYRGHEIGHHTYAHDMVSELEQSAFIEDFIKCDQILTERCGQIKHFAYTYGGLENFSRDAFDAVFKMGYESCSSGIRGCHVNQGEKLPPEEILLYRDPVIGYSKLNHLKYFMINNVERSNFQDNFAPKKF